MERNLLTVAHILCYIQTKASTKQDHRKIYNTKEKMYFLQRNKRKKMNNFDFSSKFIEKNKKSLCRHWYTEKKWTKTCKKQEKRLFS